MTRIAIAALVRNTSTFFASNATKSYQFRAEQLRKLGAAVHAYEQRISDALYKDLHKAPMETYLTEIGMVQEEVRFLSKHLKKLMKPKRVRTPLSHFLASSTIYYEPYGTVLIMSPWNYPVNLTLTPLAGAIAAGNCAVIKPSNYTPETSKVIADLIAETFDPSFVTVVTGGREENAGLLEQKFDYIFFTGGTVVGKLVMEAAARNLTPVTLELGGKSPCIIDKTADMKAAARRILFGKILNGGQTCVAPDYVLIHTAVKEAFIEQCKAVLREFFPTDAYVSCNMTRIVNDKHFERLSHLMEGEAAVIGGDKDVHGRFIPLTVLDNISFESPVMQEEILAHLAAHPVYRCAVGCRSNPCPSEAACPLSLYQGCGCRAENSVGSIVRRRMHQRHNRASCDTVHALRRRWDKRYGELPRETKLLHIQPRKERNEKIPAGRLTDALSSLQREKFQPR